MKEKARWDQSVELRREQERRLGQLGTPRRPRTCPRAEDGDPRAAAAAAAAHDRAQDQA